MTLPLDKPRTHVTITNLGDSYNTGRNISPCCVQRTHKQRRYNSDLSDVLANGTPGIPWEQSGTEQACTGFCAQPWIRLVPLGVCTQVEDVQGAGMGAAV